MKEKLSEVELGEHLIGWLTGKGWEVYQEVQFIRGSKIADIVATKNEQVWIIELKTSLTLKVLEQAFYWQDAHYKSIAVPHSRRRGNFGYTVARKFGLGVLLITEDYIDERIQPENNEPDPKMTKHWILDRLSEVHKNYSKAGSKHGGYLTPYALSIAEVKKFITENPRCSIKQIVETLGNMHWANENSAKQCIRNALNGWEKNWCDSEYETIDHRYTNVYWIRKEESKP